MSRLNTSGRTISSPAAHRRRANSSSDFSGSMDDLDMDHGMEDDVQISPSIAEAPSSSQPALQHARSSPPRTPWSRPLDQKPLDRTESLPPEVFSESKQTAVHPTRSLSGSSRFRTSAERLVRLHRVNSVLEPGSEPGVDPTRDGKEYDHIVADCIIDVVEYGHDRAEFQTFRNHDFLRYLSDVGKDKSEWAKVRWINVKGLDWNIIKAMSLVYGLHPLALEDVLHSRDCRSKVDYYRDQLFVQGLALILLKNVHDENDCSTERHHAVLKNKAPWWRRALGLSHVGEHPDLEVGRSPYGQSHFPQSGVHAEVGHMGQQHADLGPSTRKINANKATVEKLRGEKRIHVKERNVYLFMFRDGTLITFHEAHDSVNDEAIKNRLRDPNTVLRGTAEVSVLMESLLDLMVDHAVQVVDAFQDQILYLEQETLIRPHMDSVKLLHMLSADITLHKRALKPLQTMVFGMRRYDLDRCVALTASASGDPSPDVGKVRGFLGHQAKVYLADVQDHLEYVISSLEMFETITENLISYSFNILSYEMNETMSRLTLATVIFFPLTFLTGYFGMNFTHMDSIQGSDLLFWKIAIPCLFALIVMFSWSDIKKMARYLRVRNLAQQIHRAHEKVGLALPRHKLKN